MQIFGLEIARAKAAPVLSGVDGNRGWWPLIRESYTGAWQNNDEWTPDAAMAHHAVYACISLISADIAKLRLKLVELEDGIWGEVESASFSPVLRKPNAFQNHIQFKEWWMASKLVRGNTYVLKQRDNRGVVVALYVLDPSRVQVLVSEDGSVFYKLNSDNLGNVSDPNGVTVPSSEIIHDRMNCLFHPLVGVSPLFACGLAAWQGLKIQNNSTNFFGNNSSPGGVLTAPGAISQETADRLKAHWDAGYTGASAGKVAVLGDGLKFEPMRMSAVESQLIEQLKWTGDVVCSCFHVPSYMVGVGTTPSYNNIEALNQNYYGQCLQYHIESMELCLDEGLGLDEKKEGRTLGTELDLDALLRMDTSTRMTTIASGIGASVLTPNEGRKQFDLKPVNGGDSPMAQQQQFSLSALAKRDQDDPFSKPNPAAPATPALPGPPEEIDSEAIKNYTFAALSMELGSGKNLQDMRKAEAA